MKLLRTYDSPAFTSRLVMATGDLLSHIFVPLRPKAYLPVNKEQGGKVLLLRLDGIGDNVCTWPALQLLREQLPQSRITLAVGPWVAELYHECPWVDEIVEWESGLFGLFRGKGLKGLLEDIKRSVQLRKKNFHIGMDLRGDILSILLLRIIAPPVRVAHVSRGGQRLLTDPLEIREGHESQRAYNVVCSLLGRPVTQVPSVRDWPRPLALERVKARLKTAGFDEKRPAAALCPLALWPWKQWPRDHFTELSKRLEEEMGFQIIWFLEHADQAGEYASTDLVFTGPLDEAAAALSLCRLAVSSDSGLLHLAVAAGCRTVQLFGPGDADRFAHTGEGLELHHDRSCRDYPCVQRGTCVNISAGWCLEKISIDEVFASCQRLIAALHGQTSDVEASQCSGERVYEAPQKILQVGNGSDLAQK